MCRFLGCSFCTAVAVIALRATLVQPLCIHPRTAEAAPQPWPGVTIKHEKWTLLKWGTDHHRQEFFSLHDQKSLIVLCIYKQWRNTGMYYVHCCNRYVLSACGGQGERKCFHWFVKILECRPLLTASVLPETEEGDLTPVGTKGCSGEQTPSHRPKTPL